MGRMHRWVEQDGDVCCSSTPLLCGTPARMPFAVFIRDCFCLERLLKELLEPVFVLQQGQGDEQQCHPLQEDTPLLVQGYRHRGETGHLHYITVHYCGM